MLLRNEHFFQIKIEVDGKVPPQEIDRQSKFKLLLHKKTVILRVVVLKLLPMHNRLPKKAELANNILIIPLGLVVDLRDDILTMLLIVLHQIEEIIIVLELEAKIGNDPLSQRCIGPNDAQVLVQIDHVLEDHGLVEVED